MTHSNGDFWLGRWKRGEIGWHQADVEPALVKWAENQKPARVLVPLCGKSHDLAWLSAHGFDVTGVELSEIACESFFTENKIDFKKVSQGDFQVFSGGDVRIFCGDFFKLHSNQLGGIDFVYDRAALIALPEELRANYARHLMSLMDSSLVSFLQIAIARTPHDLTGPPHSVQSKEIESLYGEKFQITLQSKELVTARAPEGSRTEEMVFYLTPRA